MYESVLRRKLSTFFINLQNPRTVTAFFLPFQKTHSYGSRLYKPVFHPGTRSLSISVAYMSKIIKKITGENFTEIIRKLKMEEASDLLIQTDDPIEKISEQAGYNSSDHFARTFRKYYSISPPYAESPFSRIYTIFCFCPSYQ